MQRLENGTTKQLNPRAFKVTKSRITIKDFICQKLQPHNIANGSMTQ